MCNNKQLINIWIYIILVFGCAPSVSSKNIEEPAPVPAAVKTNGESEKESIYPNWIDQCRSHLNYLEKYETMPPELHWNKQKKERVTTLTVKRTLETASEWLELGVNDDNGKLPVNIKIGLEAAPQNGFLLSDGEVQTTVEWQKSEQKEQTPIKSWTGTRDGIEKEIKINGKDTVCLLGLDLLSWGTVSNKDVVVVAEDMNESSGCLEYSDGKWQLEGWSTYGSEPVYSIIMWEENGEWKSTVRSKRVLKLTLDEICQALGEEWKAVPPEK
jgi:hypothetical protein